MTAFHFYLQDLRGIFIAIFLLTWLIAVPGYVIGWVTGVLSFRRRALHTRLALAAPLGISISPILAYALARCVSITAVWIFFGLLAAAFATHLPSLLRELTTHKRCRLLRVAFALAGVWTLFAVAELLDLGTGSRLYYSVTAWDYSIRAAITNSLSQGDLPALSPFFRPGEPVLLRYHYFWYFICGLTERLAGTVVAPWAAIVGGTVWCGVGMLAIVPLYLRFFDPKGRQDILLRSLWGVSLLAVTGLDLIPNLAFYVRYLVTGDQSAVWFSSELWNNIVGGWIYSLLWVPHYMAALIASLMGFLIIWNDSESLESSMRKRIVAGVVAGFAFASAAGLGIYVGMVFDVFLIAWTIASVLRRRNRQAATIVLAGLVCLLCLIPYFLDLLRSSVSGGEAALQWTVRSFTIPERILRIFGVDGPLITLANLLLLPTNYLFELGLFFVVAQMQWRRFRSLNWRLEPSELAAGLMLFTSVFICTFLKSSVIAANDLGWRGFLIAQFVLLLWAVPYIAEWWRNRRVTSNMNRRFRLFLAIGVLSTGYEVFLIRAYPVLADRGSFPMAPMFSPDRHLGERTFAVRQAYEQMQNITPVTAVIQHHPEMFLEIAPFLYSRRPMVAGGLTCSTEFGGAPERCNGIRQPLLEVFNGAKADGSTPNVEQVCRDLSIDYLFARDTDPVWRKPESWVWTVQPIVANSFVRVIPCHGQVVQNKKQ